MRVECAKNASYPIYYEKEFVLQLTQPHLLISQGIIIALILRKVVLPITISKVSFGKQIFLT